MKKSIISILAMMTLLAFVSCQKDKINDDSGNGDNPETEKHNVSLNLTLPSGNNWGKDARIGVFNESNTISNLEVSIKSGDGTPAGAFEFETTEESLNEIYVYSPYMSGQGMTAGTAQIEIPEKQKYDLQEQTLPAAIFAGKSACEEYSCEIGMQKLNGIVRFSLKSDGYFEGAVTALEIKAEKAAGTFVLDMTGEKPSISHKSGSGSVTLDLANVTLGKDGEAVSVPVAMAPGSYKAVTLSAVTAIGNVEIQPVDFEVSVTEETSVEIMLTDPSVVIEDLNADGEYANSYIADKSGVIYKFDAKVMGTGVATEGLAAPETLDPKDVFVLWETGKTVGNIIKSVSLSDDGIVSFILEEGADGNAVIAVTDGQAVEGDWPRSRGTILWSWHIWAVKDLKDVTCTSYSGTEYTIMDRNLGEWNQPDGTDQYQGLKYQWGRKDPFVGFNSAGEVIENSVVAAEKDYIQVPGYITSTGSNEETLKEAVAFPEIFFGASYYTSNDWYGTGSGEENRNNALWGFIAEGNYVKTIYDPCPAGYKVAPMDAFTGFTKTGAAAFMPDDFNVEGSFDNGWYFTAANSFFPASGSMAFNNGVLRMVPGPSGREGYYWTATPDGENAKMIDFTSSALFMNSNKRASGCSVRCVRVD